MGKIWRRTKENDLAVKEQRRSLFSRTASHIYRNWGLAKKLEHVRNRGKGHKQHKD